MSIIQQPRKAKKKIQALWHKTKERRSHCKNTSTSSLISSTLSVTTFLQYCVMVQQINFQHKWYVDNFTWVPDWLLPRVNLSIDGSNVSMHTQTKDSVSRRKLPNRNVVNFFCAMQVWTKSGSMKVQNIQQTAHQTQSVTAELAPIQLQRLLTTPSKILHQKITIKFLTQ